MIIMANVSIKPAATGRYTHKYNPNFVGSLDFGDFMVSRCVEVEKSDEWKFNKVRGTLRLAPQVFPAYGKNTLKSAAFFVPSKQLLESYDQLRNNKSAWKGKPVVVPYFSSLDISELFYDRSSTSGGSLGTIVGQYSDASGYQTLKAAGTHWDFVYFVPGSTTKFKFIALSPLGKRFYKVFKMLGYDFASYEFWTGDDAKTAASADVTCNAFPLLAYAKVYCDYFLSPHQYNTSVLVSFLQRVHDSESVSVGTLQINSFGHIDSDTLYNLISYILVPYEHNMYLDAWNSPNSPLGVDPSSESIDLNPSGGLVSPIIPNGIDPGHFSLSETVSVNENSSLLVGTKSSSDVLRSGLTSLGLNFLEGVYKFVKRNNLFGSKAIQQFFARFGIKDSDWNSQFVHKLYEGVSEIDYSAVLSNSDTVSGSNGMTLGSYAGFGVSGLNFSFGYKSSDPGYIVVLHWIQITPMLRRGFDPSVLRIKPFDWYTPEFDGKTLRAIPQCEVSVDTGSGITGYNGDRKIFGFTDIYEEYRNMKDSIVGDFIVDEEISNFVFARDLSYFRELNNTALQPQTNRIQYYAKGGSFPDVTNPFQWSPINGDRFYLYIQYDITANRSITSKSNSLDLNGEGDMQIQLGGTQLR